MITWSRYRELCAAASEDAVALNRQSQPILPQELGPGPGSSPGGVAFVHRPTWLPWRRPFIAVLV